MTSVTVRIGDTVREHTRICYVFLYIYTDIYMPLPNPRPFPFRMVDAGVTV